MTAKGLVMESAISFRQWQSLFLITLHAFILTGNEGVCDESLFSFTLCQSLILIKLQALVKNDSERFCDGVSEGACF